MSSGASGSDSKISGAKIDPLASDTKAGVPHDQAYSHGAAGTDHNIDQARIDPIGGHGHGQHPAPHADSQGVTGREGVVQGTKIAPLDEGTMHKVAGGPKMTGLDDESVDASRIKPMGEVREDMD